MVAVASPTEKVGPVQKMARWFSANHGRTSSQNDGNLKEDEEDISRILAQAKLSTAKPLPLRPSATSSPPKQQQRQQHYQHSQQYPQHLFANQVPRATSLQNVPHSHQAAHYHQQPSSSADRVEHFPSYMPLPNPYDQSSQRQAVLVDQGGFQRLTNPWEMTARTPSSSFNPTKLLTPHPPRPASAPIPVVRKVVRRGKAVVADASQPPGLHQCWGIKRDGTRCTRRVGHAGSALPEKRRLQSKSPSPSKSKNKAGTTQEESIVISDSSESEYSEDDERREFCHQHAKEINKTDGFILPGLRDARTIAGDGGTGGDGLYIDFNDYLKLVTSLEASEVEKCKAKLRTAMSQGPSEIDWVQRGYIYIYELRDRSTQTHIALKVGRAVNVHKRFDQWRTQCQSKSPLLRSFFPRANGAGQYVLIPGAANFVVEKGAYLSHKWEALCHIELSFIGQRLSDKCADCGSRHREIFLVPRSRVGYDGVRACVERWLSFVQVLAKDGLGSGGD